MNNMELNRGLQPPVEPCVVSAAPDISNLSACIDDVKKAALDEDPGPQMPTNYNELRSRLESSEKKLPPLYREAVYNPFMRKLDELGPEGFDRIFTSPVYRDDALVAEDIAKTILQNGEGYNERATDAFQEVVSDLYDGFLSAEDRAGVKPPDITVNPPLVKWGNPSFGPYTIPVDPESLFNIKAAIVNLPPSNAKGGLLAWSALGHETGGHDILHADIGLLEELSRTVLSALQERNIGSGLPHYWADRIDETASDVLGILNMGPAAGIGLIGYFRGLNLAFSGKAALRNIGPEDDPHPADILRGYLAASSVRLLEFSPSSSWAKAIENETDKDLSRIVIGRKVIDPEEAKESAMIVASAIINTRLRSLENHKLSQIQNWRDQDEAIVKNLGSLLTTSNPLPTGFEQNIYATHAVAAAVIKALEGNANIPLIFDRMQAILKIMHDSNPSWGPLFVRYRGDIAPRFVYDRGSQGNIYH